MSYFDSFSKQVADTEISKKEGLSYWPAAMAMAAAGRPVVKFVDFDGAPMLTMLGGAVVAVDMLVPGTEQTQRMWLPVMDRDNMTVSTEKLTLTDVNNARQRCLVKALAAVYGVGMSLYLGCDGDGQKAAKLLGVAPDSDLVTVPPVVATLKEGGAPYVEWGIGLAACRITDPGFTWEVVMWGDKPYRTVLGGVMVDVDADYRGKRQRISLPLMDAAFNAIPGAKATVFDWNKAIMRALTKCIAFNTGYGLSVYAEEVADKDGKGSRGRRGKTEAAPAAPQAAASEVVAPVAPVAVSTPEPTKPETLETKAEATPESKAVLQPAQTPSPEVAEAVSRFSEVMRKRRDAGGVQGVISLFDALVTSTKFSDIEKPACFAMLVPACTSVVTAEHIDELLDAIKKHKALDYLGLDTRDIVAAKLTQVKLTTACEAGEEALQGAPNALVAAGVAQSSEEVLAIADYAHVSKEIVDLLRDLMATA